PPPLPTRRPSDLRPGRGSSVSPSNRSTRNRDLHLPTVTVLTPTLAATSVLLIPSAAASTILHRWARPCDDLRRRAHRFSCSRSESLNVIGARGCPRLLMSRDYPLIERTSDAGH